MGLPWWFSGKKKNLLPNTGDMGSIRGSKDFLEKEMATHSNTLAWEIPWTEEPDGLQSVGSQESDTTYWLNNKKQYKNGLPHVGEN